MPIFNCAVQYADRSQHLVGDIEADTPLAAARIAIPRAKLEIDAMWDAVLAQAVPDPDFVDDFPEEDGDMANPAELVIVFDQSLPPPRGTSIIKVNDIPEETAAPRARM